MRQQQLRFVLLLLLVAVDTVDGIVFRLFAQIRAAHAAALVDAVVQARGADALAASVVEPAIARGAHALAVGFALVPRQALRHECHRAVVRDDFAADADATAAGGHLVAADGGVDFRFTVCGHTNQSC